MRGIAFSAVGCAIALLALACGQPPAPSPDTEALRAELDALRERVEAGEAAPAVDGATAPCPAVEEVAGADAYAVDRSAELEAENEALRAEVVALRGEVARYRDGLEQAVGQLNAGQVQRQMAATTDSLGAVVVLDHSFEVTERASIWWRFGYSIQLSNTRPRDASVDVEVQFLNASGHVVDTARHYGVVVDSPQELVTGSALISLPAAAEVASMRVLAR